ncbi:MAG: hypothetical protein WCG80_19240 [Spirochaetales bacterium]
MSKTQGSKLWLRMEKGYNRAYYWLEIRDHLRQLTVLWVEALVAAALIAIAVGAIFLPEETALGRAAVVVIAALAIFEPLRLFVYLVILEWEKFRDRNKVEPSRKVAMEYSYWLFIRFMASVFEPDPEIKAQLLSERERSWNLHGSMFGTSGTDFVPPEGVAP